ncbi:MAG: PQQ-binding-like beta-propeller repeat protein, partial [Acidimicrobiales bacterium]
GAGGLALAVPAASPAGAAPAPSVTFGKPVWTQTLRDGGSPVALSSPNVAQLPGGPAVVVGDQAGGVYAYNLASGGPAWSYATGAPVTSTPSVAPTTAGSSLDSVFVGTGDAGTPYAGGYQAISPTGGDQWFVQESNPPTDGTAHNGVQASMAVGNLQGGTDVVAGSLGENEYAMTAGGGAVLSGFPWFQADSNFSTPAIADLYGNGNEIVEGGDSSAGLAYTTQYQNGGHIRVLSATGNAGQPRPNGGLVCQYTTNETVYSSPAVGEFLGSSSEVGIVVGTGTHFHGSNTNQLVAVDSHCNFLWSATLNGNTKSSPALADVLGNGQLQVVEGTDNGSTGSVYALNGSNGATIWQATVGRVIGSVVTVDLGSGYQDVLAPTTNGVAVLTGKTGGVITRLQTTTGFQNSPLVTDTTGAIGITLAGYQGSGTVITHYRIAGSDGSVVNEGGAWPQFHHDPSLSGDAGTAQNVEVPCSPPPTTPSGYYMSASDGGIFAFGNLPFCGSTGSITLNKPVVGMAATADAGGYWEVASDGGLFAFGDAAFYGSMGGQPLNQPVVGMAATPTGGGYWEVASDGGLFAFGNAAFYGSMGGKPLNQPIVGMAATPTGHGYWEVAADGGLFAFGNATFYGSMGGKPLNRPIVGIAANGSGGYWEVASDGGIFAFGDAPFYGSMGGQPLNQPIVSMEAVPSGRGYRFAAADGGLFAFGTAPFDGSMGGKPLNKPVVAMAGF